jgi:hypothetical protein
MIKILPYTQREIVVLEVNAGSGVGTTRFIDELTRLDFNYFLYCQESRECNRFYLSMNLPPTHIFITSLERVPPRTCDVILLPEGIKNPKLLKPFVKDTTIIVIRYAKLFKSRLEKYFVCTKSNENHWYFGVYMCFLRPSPSFVSDEETQDVSTES